MFRVAEAEIHIPHELKSIIMLLSSCGIWISASATLNIDKEE
jgi:hypothetical protein